MNDFDTIAAQYISVWNETDPASRKASIATLWSDGGRYVDPLGSAVGHDEIDATIAAVQQQFAGFRFRLAGPVDGHHDQARFGWELGPVEGAAPIAGFDVVERGADGRLVAVLGFLDRVPAS